MAGCIFSSMANTACKIWRSGLYLFKWHRWKYLHLSLQDDWPRAETCSTTSCMREISDILNLITQETVIHKLFNHACTRKSAGRAHYKYLCLCIIKSLRNQTSSIHLFFFFLSCESSGTKLKVKRWQQWALCVPCVGLSGWLCQALLSD